MIDMSQWDELVADVVDGLHLDPHNVRLELPLGVPEADIIHDLFTNEKAFSLVESIVKVGFLTHEVPIVLRRKGRLVVVEGNRRVAALKAIQNPLLAPDFRTRITRLVQNLPQRERLRRITVKVAPNQDDADQLIAALHTGNQRVAWSPARQAAFFQAQINAGKTAEELVSQYPTVDVRKFILRSHILDLFRTVDYKDAQLKDYVTQRTFPVSTLARLYDYDRFLHLLQIEVNEAESTVELRMPRKQFAVLAEKIIGDIKNKVINTRKLNSTTSEPYVAYMDALRTLVDETASIEDDEDFAPQNPPPASSNPKANRPASPKPNNGGSGQGNPEGKKRGEPGQASNGKPAEPETPPAKPQSIKRSFLDTEDIQVPATFPYPIHAAFKELSDINIKRFPNATFDLLRTFLEKTIKAYAESLNEDIRTQFNVKGFVFLNHCLSWLEEHVKRNGQTAYIQVIAKVRGGKVGSYVPTVDHLNAINHNHQVFATPDDVRECWMTMKGLFKIMFKV
ncbi:hypothetical protein AB0O34_35105 [Sphaerisporangium sp. NPDC088356]|uniref:hypothetical protein n=1 Tax=Sphaerisporangium sp. NPDC088356 TaxID=3154871 RepID=UPI003426D478